MKTVPAPAPAPAISPPTATLMSGERLAAWAAKGSQPPFAVIFEHHHHALHRYSMRQPMSSIPKAETIVECASGYPT